MILAFQSGELWGFVRKCSYLKHLATSAKEWFQQPRDSQADLERQLVVFRKSCDKLLAASHSQLSNEKRIELDKRCRTWAEQIDGYLVSLRTNQKSLDQVRTEVDNTIRKLITALDQGLA